MAQTTLPGLQGLGGPEYIIAIADDAQVTALASLLQHPSARLCPAASTAATDATLSLLSGLKAAQLQLSANDDCHELAKRVERAMQRLLQALHTGLAPPTPAPVAQHGASSNSGSRGSAAGDSQQRRQLSDLVGALGSSTRDWQAAQAGVAQRTAAALQQLPSPAYERGLAAAPSEAGLGLDRLLSAAVSLSAWDARSCQPSTLHAAVQQLLHLLRQYPPAGAPLALAGAGGGALPPPRLLPLKQQQQPEQARLQLTAEGWAAYWLLEPLALQQALAEILQAACNLQQAQPLPSREDAAAATAAQTPPPPLPPLGVLLQQQPHWAATAAAVRRHPELHAVVRRTLHAWLAASGNPAVWRLLLLYFSEARGGSGGQQEQSGHQGQQGQQQGQGQSGQQAAEQWGALPVHLRVLHPAALSPTAALLLTEQPSEAGLALAVAQLQAFLEGTAQPAGDTAQQAQHAQQQQGQQQQAQPGQTWQQGQHEQVQWQGEQQGQHDLHSSRTTEQLPAVHRDRAAWQLQLDAPAWALYCLHRLPLQRLLALASGSVPTGSNATPDGARKCSGEDNSMTEAAAAGAAADGAGAGTSAGVAQLDVHLAESPAGALASAAHYTALLVWPGERRRQAVLAEALQGRLCGVSLPAIRPWLEQVASWERLLLPEGTHVEQ